MSTHVCRTKDEAILVAKTHRENDKKAVAQEVATVMVVEAKEMEV
jgi:hypothetical protein